MLDVVIKFDEFSVLLIVQINKSPCKHDQRNHSFVALLLVFIQVIQISDEVLNNCFQYQKSIGILILLLLKLTELF